MKKLLALFGLVLLLPACASQEGAAPADTPEELTLTGTFMCLPHKEQGEFETMECAFGMQTADGKYYAVDLGLSSEGGVEPPMGEEFTATGVFTPIEQLSNDYWQRYPIEGIFSVTKLQ